MNKLQSFCAALECGFLSEAQIVELEKLDRLFPVLVRCGGCRFTCGVQDYAHLSDCISAGGDYVRDVSLPIGWEARAAAWVDGCLVTPAASLPASFVAPRADTWTEAARAAAKPVQRFYSNFNEADCGGVFDGRGVVSDADPGL